MKRLGIIIALSVLIACGYILLDLNIQPHKHGLVPSANAVSVPYVTIANFPPCQSGGSACGNNGPLFNSLLAMYPTANTLLPCVTMQAPWSRYDTGTTAANYNFAQLKSDMQAIWANGGTHNGPNCINLVVAPIVSGTNNTFTPVYPLTTTYQTAIGAVRQQTITACQAFQGGGTSPYNNTCANCTPVNCPGPGGCRYVYDPTGVSGVNDTSGFPVMIPAEPITTAWEAFASALISYAVSNNFVGLFNTQYIRFGLGTGGEANIACTGDWIVDSGFNNSTEQIYVLGNDAGCTTSSQANCHGTNAEVKTVYTAIAGYAQSNAAKFTINYNYHTWNPTSDTGAADLMATIITALTPLGSIDTNGLQTGDITSNGNGGTCSADWCAINAKYRSVPFSILQTFSVSDPTNSNPNGCGTGVTCPGATTGSLEIVLPYAANHFVNVIEIYPQDAMITQTSTFAGLPATVQTNVCGSNANTPCINNYSGYGGSSGSYANVVKLFGAGAMISAPTQAVGIFASLKSWWSSLKTSLVSNE